MPNLRPLRDISDHEIIPFFAFSGTYPTLKGTPVKIVSGFYADQAGPSSYGSVGATYQNFISNRYGVQAQVGVCTASGDNVVGFLLYDARETDENGEKLILHPDKAERMQARPSGWAIPIVRRGFVEYSGAHAANAKGGETAYLFNDGSTITTTGSSTLSTKVGKFYGPMDSNGYIMVHLDVNY
jgi:hypothetical protein